VRTGLPWIMNAAPTGTLLAASGLAGGEPGATGRFLVNGAEWEPKGKVQMQPGDVVHMETPGAGGFGPPAGQDNEPNRTGSERAVQQESAK
jgi:N-methylhydantoinase B